MCTFKKLKVLTVLVFALSALGAADASAATFTAKSIGSLTGKATETQVFTTSAGQIKCNTAETSGTVTSLASPEQHVSVNYKNCTALGFASVHASPATYLLTASGTVHLKSPIKFKLTVAECEIVFTSPQSKNADTYINNADHTDITITRHLTNLHWNVIPAHGTLCGTTGTTGTSTGNTTFDTRLTVDP